MICLAQINSLVMLDDIDDIMYRWRIVYYYAAFSSQWIVTTANKTVFTRSIQPTRSNSQNYDVCEFTKLRKVADEHETSMRHWYNKAAKRWRYNNTSRSPCDIAFRRQGYNRWCNTISLSSTRKLQVFDHQISKTIRFELERLELAQIGVQGPLHSAPTPAGDIYHRRLSTPARHRLALHADWSSTSATIRNSRRWRHPRRSPHLGGRRRR